MDEFYDLGWRTLGEEARRVAAGGPVYLTFDIDSLDPSQAPGTGTPEAGGIMVLDALRLLRALRGIDFVGGDLVEVAPPFDIGTLTAFNGASILFEILCLLAEAHEKQTGVTHRVDVTPVVTNLLSSRGGSSMRHVMARIPDCARQTAIANATSASIRWDPAGGN